MKIEDFNQEDVLREKMLAFERAQAKRKREDGKPLRGPLPCDVRARHLVVPTRAVTRQTIYEKLIAVINEGEAIPSSEFAYRSKLNYNSVATYLRQMSDHGLLHRLPCQHQHYAYVYVLTGKRISEILEELNY